MVFSVVINTRNRGRVCLFLKKENEEFWVEVLIVTFLDVVATPQMF